MEICSDKVIFSFFLGWNAVTADELVEVVAGICIEVDDFEEFVGGLDAFRGITVVFWAEIKRFSILLIPK